MKKIISVIFVLVIISCEAEMNNKEKLPFNSATILLNEKSKYEEITEPSAKNIDLINGFRGVKLMTNVDSLHLEDWELIKFSPKIDYYENNVFIRFDSKLYQTEICLTFYDDRLTMIDIQFNNIDILNANKTYSKEDIINEVIEPKIMKTFHNTFGIVKPYFEGEEIYIGPAVKLNELTIAINTMYNKKKADVSSYLDYKRYKFPNEAFERNLYEVIEEIYQKKKSIDYYPASTTIFHNLENIKLFEYLGEENGMKILLTNKFKIFEDEGKIYDHFKLNNTLLQVKIYNLQLTREYLINKKKQESQIRKKSNFEFEKRKKLKDSITLINSASEF